MIFKYPFRFFDAKTVSPSSLEENFQHLRRVVAHSASHRYIKRSFTVPLDGLSTTLSVAGEALTIEPPFGITITGIELVCLDSDANLTSVTVAFTNDVVDSITCLKGSREYKTVRHTISGGDSFTITPSMTTTGAVTLEGTYLVVHYVARRNLTYNVGPEMHIRHGDTVNVADLNAEFQNIEDALAADIAASSFCSILVLTTRVSTVGVGSVPANKAVHRIPGVGESGFKFQSYAHAGIGTTVRMSYGVLTVGSATDDIPGAGAGVYVPGALKTIAGSSIDEPTNTARDITVETSVVAGSGFYSSTTVVYYE